jgi:hypothetical protein
VWMCMSVHEIDDRNFFSGEVGALPMSFASSRLPTSTWNHFVPPMSVHDEIRSQAGFDAWDHQVKIFYAYHNFVIGNVVTLDSLPIYTNQALLEKIRLLASDPQSGRK